MNVKDAYPLLETLMDGVNPITGELLPEDHVCQEPAVLRALHKALVALQDSDETSGDDAALINQNGELNVGRPWTRKDLDWLKQLHEAGASMEEMSHLLQRRKRGIEKQLIRLGLMSQGGEGTAASQKRSRSGTPWTSEDDKTLWDMWKQGETEDRIAKVLQRSAYAIHCRMERLGMLNPEDAQHFLPPWSLEDAQKLKLLHASGCTAEETAEQMYRPVEIVRARMFYMGLTKESPISIYAKETP